MSLAIRVHKLGGPEVMQADEVTVGDPGPGEIRMRHTAIGVNFIDTYFRTGLYSVASGLPFTPGNEGAGVIEAVGEGVNDLKVGMRVVYVGDPGAYAEQRLLLASKAVPIPDGISDELAAAVFLKGLTAQYLLRHTFKVGPEHTILFHAAAGGVGLLAGQWAKHLGARVIGTAGSQDKIDLALANGYDEVINYSLEDFVARTLELTGGEKCDVVYDSVGKTTFPGSLDVLKPLGLFVSFGQSSGPVPPFDIGILNAKGSLFATRPSIFGYNRTREALLANAAELFDALLNGHVRVHIHATYPLREAAQAHIDLEGRKTSGALILKP
jgi:NADPH:quinone reductase